MMMPGITAIAGSDGEEPPTNTDPTYSLNFPLPLIRSQVISPAPYPRKSSIDWLPEFAGCSWIAYGASSLVVILQCHSPLSKAEADVESFFRQVIEPPADAAGAWNEEVKAVAWCPSRPSDGSVAVGLGNCVRLYKPDVDDAARGSLSWRQVASLLHSYTVEAVEWTGSGDGLITAGIEVVFWKRNITSWGATNRFRAEIPQSIVSATWSIVGPVAVAEAFKGPIDTSTKGIEHSFLLPREANGRVLIFQDDGKSDFLKSELCHPHAVSLIQWRPYALSLLKKNRLHSSRDVLLTCCLDGVVRLWCEIDTLRAKKSSRDNDDRKSQERTYHVVAVIEINQRLNAILGINTFISWTTEVHDAYHLDNEHFFQAESSDFNPYGHCEWLVSLGPGQSLTFWAIHCLEDVSPVRFPRVSLWKKHSLKDINGSNPSGAKPSYSAHPSFLIKVIVSRNELFAPPIACTLLTLSPNNSFRWLLIDSSKSLMPNNEEGSLDLVHGIRGTDGHIGTIMQTAVHPFSHEFELAISLDSSGFLLFWSISTIISMANLEMKTLYNPAWKPLVKIDTKYLSNTVVYSNLAWLPCAFKEDTFLFMGHEEGIDFFLVRIMSESEDILCRRVFTISFPSQSSRDNPYHIFTTPLASTCSNSSGFNKFALLAVWTITFQVLLWEVVIHSDDLSGMTCNCSFVSNDFICVYSHASRTYHLKTNLCSSNITSSCGSEKITSFAVVSPSYLVPSIRQPTFTDELCRKAPLYHIVTGLSNGTVKMWRLSSMGSPLEHSGVKHLTWEIVGMFTAHKGSVNKISVSSCGTKIATIGMSSSNLSPVLHIWSSLCLVSGGCFSLEDKLELNELVMDLNWLSLGNGHLLLGVCMKNELQIYSQRRIDLSGEKSNWFCIAICHTNPTIKAFLWGPKVTPVMVHERHISLFSHWSSIDYMKSQGDFHIALKDKEYNSSNIVGDKKENFQDYFSSGINEFSIEESLTDKSGNGHKHTELVEDDVKSNSTVEKPCKMKPYELNSDGLHNFLKVADSLCEPLAVYNPKALILYIYSGNLKRASLALEHLVKYLHSSKTSTSNTTDTEFKKAHPITQQICTAEYFEKAVSSISTQSMDSSWGLDSSIKIFDMQFESNPFHHEGGTSLAISSTRSSAPISQISALKNCIDTLENSHDIPSLNDMERTQILAVVDLLGECIDPNFSSAYESLDEPGRRFWVAVRFQRLYFHRRSKRLVGEDDLKVESWMVAWAFQSECQENLYNSVLSPEPSWLEMRNMGVGYWFTNASQLRQKMEKLARAQYLLKRDPKDCALLYLSLNRLQVLAGLFKVSKNEKDKPLVGFLCRNFQEEKNKAAALKNAYVLMGRHQLELAAAFFLMGGDPSSCVMLCAKNLGDEQLALVICRLLQGYGGSLERQLISNVLLPNSVAKGDYWLSSILEWTLGNYMQSYKILANSVLDTGTDKMDSPSNRAVFSDPAIGKYCVMLASRNNFRSSVGEHMAVVLSKWAILAAGNALVKCGCPLESLDCLSFSFTILEDMDRNNSPVSDIDPNLNGNLDPFSSESCNWLLVDVASHLEYNFCLNAAMNYISSAFPLKMMDTCYNELQIESFNAKMKISISVLRRKYSLKLIDIINMILILANSSELIFLGYNVLQELISDEFMNSFHPTSNNFDLNLVKSNMVLKASKEICYSLARYVPYHNVICLLLLMNQGYASNHDQFSQFYSSHFIFEGLTCSLRNLRDSLNLYGSSILKDDNCLKVFMVLDYLELCLYFASAWSGQNLNEMVLMMHPIANDMNGKQTFKDGIGGSIRNFLSQASDAVQSSNFNSIDSKKGKSDRNDPYLLLHMERLNLMGSSLWKQLSDFIRQQMKSVMTEGAEDANEKTDENFPFFFSELLITALTCTFSILNKQLSSWLLHKAEISTSVNTHLHSVLSNNTMTCLFPYSFDQEHDRLQPSGNESQNFLFNVLSDISLNAEGLHGPYKKTNHFPFFIRKCPISWNDIHRDIIIGNESQPTVNYGQDFMRGTSSSKNGEDPVIDGQKLGKHINVGAEKTCSRPFKETSYFKIPNEIYKRSGELLEAMCINCIDEKQVALATNKRVQQVSKVRKLSELSGVSNMLQCVACCSMLGGGGFSFDQGITFHNLDSEKPFRETVEYIWSDNDWPNDGWAGSESTPVPNFVSQGIGLGNKKAAHIGLSGTKTLARPGRDMTGGGAFGISGYAGIGASGLGWGEPEDFEIIDPPATTENISTRSLCSHPSRPLFLAGSLNTHIYLWEFGRDKATATYGVLPAANVSPPYALASISALQFDCYGQRFATAALDGTVCTWQLEVGGRSNVYPTESSLCFNNHAFDVAYMAASGSTIAAAGHSTNNANAIIWDTLAPPTSSQASLICHEGGVRSLSVLDNGRGGGSVSPVIVTGGKNGDISLHDFRYIATGKTKQKRSNSNFKSSENLNGVLWHIPKAHIGGITRILSIPNTSLFLTSGKDGDVKLWDANKSELFFHWQKLHEKHTFLQPSSRGFGALVRAAVTDVQVLSDGFLSCGGDGIVKRIQLKNIPH